MKRDDFFEELKRVRESKGIRLEEISRRYKIRQSFLEAIENGSFEDLPEPVYTKTFVKTYADLLGLDAGPILARYAKYIEKTQPVTQPDHQTDAGQPISERALFDLLGKQGSRIGWAVLAAAVVIVLGIWAFQDKGERPTPAKPVVTEALKPPERPQETPLVPQAPVPQQEAAPPQQATAQTATPQTQAAASQTTPEPRKAEAPPVPAPVPAALNLKIEATEAAWVQVKADKLPAVQKLMQAGETLTTEAKERITVDLGNAGGVQMTFQEQALGSPGKRGEVMHLVYPEGKRTEKKKLEEPKPSTEPETD